MADKITNDITLLFKTKLDEKSKQEIGKNLKGLLENAAIGFDEAETKRNVEPIIQMIKRLFDKAEIAFDADKLLSMPSRQALEEMAKMEVDQLQLAFDKALAKSGGVKIDFGDIGLSELAAPLKQIEDELSGISKRVADTTKKSVYEIEKSLKSLSKNKEFKKIASPESIENTLLESSNDKKLHPSRAVSQLEKARDLYDKSVKEDNPWVVQYKYLLDFVSKYEKLTHQAKQKIESERPEFTQLYDMLSPKAGAVKISLEHYVDMAKGNELSEYKNQPWGRESTLKEIRDTLKNGISVKEGSGGGDNGHKNDATPPWEDNNKDTNSNKLNTKVSLDVSKSDVEKAASDAATQEQQILNQKIEETQNKIKENKKKIAEIKKDISSNKSFKMYKGIGAEDAVDFDDRDDVYSTYQADYYSSDIKAAASYAADEESHVVVAEIAPKDALMFDAKNYSKSGDYSEVLSSPAFIDDLKTKLKNRYAQSGMSEQKLQKKYAEIDKLEFIVGDLLDAEGNQMLVNEAAYDAGFDSVIFDNVLDFATNMVEGKAEGEGLSAKRQTGKTIAVLKDEILKIIGFHKVEETKNGQSVSEELLKEIPDYYHMPYQENEDGDLEPQSVADFSDNLKKNAELEAEIDAINKQNKKLQKELQELKGKVSTEVDSKVDNISNENTIEDDKVDEITAKKAETDAINQQNEVLKENIDLKAKANAQNDNIVVDADAGTDTTKPSTGDTEVKASIDTEELRGLLNSITYNVKVIQDVEPEGNKVSIDASELKSVLDGITYNVKLAQGESDADSNKIAIDEGILENVLNRITYDVKIAHDDADKTANKIAIDESALESTLNRVFGNILAPKDEGKKPEGKKEPWALEKTLNTTIKGVLDQIQTNTAKIGQKPQAQVNNSNNTLDSINKNVSEINTKIVRGTKTVIGGSNIKTPTNTKNRVSDNFDERKETQRLRLEKLRAELKATGKSVAEITKLTRGLAISLGKVKNDKGLARWREKFTQKGLEVGISKIEDKSYNDLIKDYEKLGRLRAKFEGSRTLEDRESLRILAEQVDAKRKSMGLTSQEIQLLRQKSHEAYEESKRLVDAAKQQKVINQSQKDAEKAKKDSDKAKVAQLNKIAKLEQEIGRLRADVDAETNEGVRKALEEEIQLRQQLIGLIKQSPKIEAQDDIIAYHGTTNGGFKEFNPTGHGFGSYFTSNKDVASTYAGGSNTDIDLNGPDSGQAGIYTMKINPGKTLVINAQGSMFNDLGENVIVNGQEVQKPQNVGRISYSLPLSMNHEYIPTGEIDEFDGEERYIKNPKSDGKQLTFGYAAHPSHRNGTVAIDDKEYRVGGTLEQVKGQLLEQGVAESIVNYLIEEIKRYANSGAYKIKDGFSNDVANPLPDGEADYRNDSLTHHSSRGRPGASILYDKDIDEIIPTYSNEWETYAWSKGYDTVKFEDVRDVGAGAMGMSQDEIPISDVYAVRDASQAQIVDSATIQDDKNNALEEEISLRDRILEKQKQGLELDAQEEAYYRQMVANHTKQAKAEAKQDAKDIKNTFKEQEKEDKKRAADAKKLAQREAMLGKTGSAVGRAESTWVNAVGLEGDLPASFTTEIDEYYQKLDMLRKKHQELKNSDMISEEQKNELITQTMEINKMTGEISELVAEYQRLSGNNTSVIGVNALGADAGIGAYEQQLKQTVMTATDGKAQIKSFDAATQTLTYTVKTGKNEFTQYTAAVRHLDGQLVAVQGTTKKTETFLEATKRKMKEISSYMSGMALISRAGQELRRGIQYVREIDLALTELRKVTNETKEEYDQFLKTASKTGARLGTTISAVTEATATFAKLGYTMEQATEMAESAIVYKNVGDNIENTGDAADSIISTLKGFRLEVTDTMKIVDSFNEVGNRFAITSQGIGEALRLSASALNEGGNSLHESIGLITAANEVVNDPSSVGTALKTLTLRLRGSKTELEEMGEDVSDMATTTSALQAKLLALTGGQVDIMLDENTFKNSTQILREMADAWEDMTDIQRAEWCPYVQKCA